MYNTGNSSKNVTTTSIVDGTISNADVDASAAIAQSKLATLAITDSEVANDALSGDKIDGGTISDFASTGIDDNATSTAITINSSEQVGIGGDPDYKLDSASLGHNSTGELLVTAGNSAENDYTQSTLLRLRATSINPNAPSHTDAAAVGEIRFLHHNLAGSASAGSITFGTNYTNNTESVVEHLRIDKSGDITLNTGDLVIGTAGKGIDFSAQTATATGTTTSEIFDSYEEGTFTPTLLGSSSNPTVTYSTQSGKYTKIGRLVTINIYLYTTDYSGGSGNIRIGGLPFAAANENPESTGVIMGFNVDTGAEATPSVSAGESFAQIMSRGTRDTSTGWGNAQVGIWTSASPTIAKVCITYEV